MRSLLETRSVAPRVAVPTAVALLALACAACAQAFEGPYPCNTGFASCGGASDDSCETNVNNDALNCGGCARTCPTGAACVEGVCGAAPVMLASLGMNQTQAATFAVNSSAAFWTGSLQGTVAIVSVPTSGGSPSSFATDGQCLSGQAATQAFAVDDDNVYYVSNGSSGQSNFGGPALIARPLDGGSPTVLVSGNDGSDVGGPGNGTAGLQSCPVLAVAAPDVYGLGSTQSGTNMTTLASVPIGGGPVAVIASNASYQTNALVIAGGNAVLEANNNSSGGGPNNAGFPYAVVPVGGGSPTTVVASNNEGSPIAFTADTQNIYYVTANCPCDNGNGGSQGSSGGSPSAAPPNGSVVILPLDGTQPTVLAQFAGWPTSIAVDESNVYWATDTALWTVPIAGGSPAQLAGNLSGGMPAVSCSPTGNCGSPASPGLTTRIAIDSTSVYVADFASSVDALFKVPK
jgi:hypothetical protein